MANRPRYTTSQVIAALRASKGMVYLAAKRLRCAPNTIHNYCHKYPAVQAAKEAQRGEMLDLAETQLLKSIRRGEAWGITFALKTLGKERGYVERQEVTGKDGAEQVIRVVYEDEHAPQGEGS